MTATSVLIFFMRRTPGRSSPWPARELSRSCGLLRPLLQLFGAADETSVDEDLRNRFRAGDRADHLAAQGVRQRHFGVIVSQFAQALLRPCTVSAAFAGEDRDLIGFLRV